jgi:hypothetical protein
MMLMSSGPPSQLVSSSDMGTFELTLFLRCLAGTSQLVCHDEFCEILLLCDFEFLGRCLCHYRSCTTADIGCANTTAIRLVATANVKLASVSRRCMAIGCAAATTTRCICTHGACIWGVAACRVRCVTYGCTASTRSGCTSSSCRLRTMLTSARFLAFVDWLSEKVSEEHP